ncbi:MAG: putative transport system permease protein [Deferribacteres bacterium]|nr:putative transport system permease protein [Deferribacteres bacterium]
MNIFTIPFKNLKVKFFKTAILIFVFAIGITSSVALNKVSSTVSEALEEKMNKFGANILVYPKTDEINISYGGVQLGNLSYEVKYLPETDVVEKIRNIEFNKNISAVAPKLVKAAKLEDKLVGVVGIVPQEEIKIKSYWNISGKMIERGDEVIIGSNIAKKLNKNMGDKIQLYDSNFTISGVIESTGSEEDNLIFANLHQLQNLTGETNKINFVEVSALCAGCPIEDIVSQIKGAIHDAEINAVQKLVKQRMSAVHFVEKLAAILSGVIIFIACFMLAIFMLSSVTERKKEIGILRAVGYSKSNIFIIFITEALLIGIMSGLVGYTSGYFLSFKILDILHIEAGKITFSFLESVLVVIAVGLIAIISSSLPAAKAAKITPSEALIAL